MSNSPSSSSSESTSSPWDGEVATSEVSTSEASSPSTDPSSDFFASQSLTLLFGRMSLLFAFNRAKGAESTPDFAGSLREVEADVVVDGMVGTC
jgi:hypothetical protein